MDTGPGETFSQVGWIMVVRGRFARSLRRIGGCRVGLECADMKLRPEVMIHGDGVEGNT